MGWNEIANGQGTQNGEAKEVNYTKLPVGQTKIRILDEEPYSRWTHWIQQANGGKGQSIDCIGNGCPICEEVKKAKKEKTKAKYNSTQSHCINIYNYNTKQVELLDKGNKIFGQIATIFSQMGDVRNYDLTITRTGEDLGSINYTTLPVFPPKELDEALKKVCEVTYDIQALKSKLTREQILMLMAGKSLADFINNEEEQSNDLSNEDIDLSI